MITFNYRGVLALFAMGILLICLLGVILSAGCISKAETQERAIVQTTINPFPVTITPTETPIESPAPVYVESLSEWKYRNHWYNLSEWLTWRRDDVSGLKDMIVHVTVYGYRTEPNFQEHSTSWGTDAYFLHIPEYGNKYLFLYVCMYMDGNTEEKDPRMWGMEADHFILQIGNTTYPPMTGATDPLEPIKELENVYDRGSPDNLNIRGQGIKPYGYKDLVPNSGQRTKIYQESWLRMGFSNKWDGWILYEIPAKARPEDITVLARFEHLGGNAFWSLMK